MLKNQQIFEILKDSLSASARYNAQKKSVEINPAKLNKKVDIALDLLHCPEKSRVKLKQHIKLACEKAVQEINFNEKSQSDSLSSLITKSQDMATVLSSTILRFGSLQESIFSKQSLDKAIDDSEVDSGMKDNIRKASEKAFYALRDGSIDSCVEALHGIQGIGQTLDQYVKDMKLPTWWGEIFLRKVANSTAASSNSSAIKELNSAIRQIQHDSLLDDRTKAKLAHLALKCSDSAESVESAMKSNNWLLARIEGDIGAKKHSVETIRSKLEAFKCSVAEGLVLKCLQQNDKVFGSKLHDLKIALESTPKYFDTPEKVDSYLDLIKGHYSESGLSSALAIVCQIEAKTCVKTKVGQNLKDLSSSFSSLVSELSQQKNAMSQNEGLPMLVESMKWERTTWEWFKASFASVSKAIIGSYHESVFGDAPGVEGMRRIAEEVSKTCGSEFDFDPEAAHDAIWAA